jgi:hypothetical protein
MATLRYMHMIVCALVLIVNKTYGPVWQLDWHVTIGFVFLRCVRLVHYEPVQIRVELDEIFCVFNWLDSIEIVR